MSYYSPISAEAVTTIADMGFSVYVPASGLTTYLYYTDGKRIGFLQKGYFGGYEISTVHVPNASTGTGFGVGPIDALTKEELCKAFYIPSWAKYSDLQNTRPWESMEAFFKSQRIIPLVLEREAKEF